MSLPDHIEEVLANNEACLLEPRDEYDACIIGLGYRCSTGPLAVYSIPLVLGVMRGWGMDEEEAEEFYQFNTIGAWMGDGTPIFVYPFSDMPDGWD